MIKPVLPEICARQPWRRGDQNSHYGHVDGLIIRALVWLRMRVERAIIPAEIGGKRKRKETIVQIPTTETV